MIPRGFELWKSALEYDRGAAMQNSKSSFQASAKAFFDEAGENKIAIARALLEYSTVMDAFSSVQEGRILMAHCRFDEALPCFAKASEIFRATVHFGFLAGYVSGCASLETVQGIEDKEEQFQGFKNAIALFEQAKLALGFRDERHPLIRSIDAMIKFGISRALLVESQMLEAKGAVADSRKKRDQSKNVETDFHQLSGGSETTPISRFRIDYFLKGYECERALKSSFLTSFPERTSLWIGNVGIHPAHVASLGRSSIDRNLAIGESLVWPMDPEFKGKLRITYSDLESNFRYDEGCLTVI